MLIFQQNPYRSPRGLHTGISLTRILVQTQTSVTQKNGMIQNWNQKKKKKNYPKLRPKNTMTEDANCKNLKKMGNEDWLLSYCIIFIPYHFISSYADVRLSMWVYSYMAWLKVLTFTCVDYWEGFWGLLHTRGLQFCRNI